MTLPMTVRIIKFIQKHFISSMYIFLFPFLDNSCGWACCKLIGGESILDFIEFNTCTELIYNFTTTTKKMGSLLAVL